MKTNEVVVEFGGNRSVRVIISAIGSAARVVVTIPGKAARKKRPCSSSEKPLQEFRQGYRAAFNEEVTRVMPSLPLRVRNRLRAGSELGLDYEIFNGVGEAEGFGALSARSSLERYCEVSGRGLPDFGNHPDWCPHDSAQEPLRVS